MLSTMPDTLVMSDLHESAWVKSYETRELSRILALSVYWYPILAGVRHTRLFHQCVHHMQEPMSQSVSTKIYWSWPELWPALETPLLHKTWVFEKRTDLVRMSITNSESASESMLDILGCHQNHDAITKAGMFLSCTASESGTYYTFSAVWYSRSKNPAVWHEHCCIHQLEFVFLQVQTAQQISSKRFTLMLANMLDTLAHSDEYGIAWKNSHQTEELTELLALFRIVATNTCRHRTPMTVPRFYYHILSSIYLRLLMRHVSIFLHRAVIELN